MRRRSLRASLGALLVAVLLPLTLAGSALLVHQWHAQRAAALARLQDEARTLRRVVDRELAVDRAVLMALAASRDVARGDWRDFHASAVQASGVRPGSWIVLYDAAGQNLVNTSVPLGTALPNFRDLLSSGAEGEWNGVRLPFPGRFLFLPFETGKPSFSGLFYGPVNRKPVVATTVPVTVAGKRRYAIALAYSADSFTPLLRARSSGGLITALFDGRGRFITRSDDPERFVAHRGPAPFGDDISALPREGVGESVGLSGARFVYAFARSTVNDWTLVAGMPRSAVLAPAWRSLWTWFAVLVTAGVVGSLLAFRLWRRVGIPLRLLAHQAEALGDATPEMPPSDVLEVEALRTALRDAARNERLRRQTEQEREEARQRLRDSEEKFRSVFEQAAIGMGRVSFADARWVDVNDAFCRMLGYTREELLRTPWPHVTHPEDVDLDLVPFRRMAAGELDSYTVEKRFLHAEGRVVWARLTLSAVRDAAGRPEYEIAIIEDVTAQKRGEDALRDANERLRDADRRKDEFIGVLSHELRNPLAPIRNSLAVLERAGAMSSIAERARGVISRQVSHLSRLVDDLLDVTRVARGKIQLHPVDVDVVELARRAAEDHRTLMEDAEVSFEVHAAPGPLTIHADEARVTQIIGNLLQNARKFTPEGGRVVLSVERDRESVLIRVRDSGAGIPPDLLPHVFEAFTQAKQTLARSEGGLGLGLSLVKGLAELQGGEVRAASAGPGHGAEFTVVLPLAAAGATESAPAQPEGDRSPADARPHRRVMVVDDNVDAAESLAELVRLYGHDVDVAYDGPTAVEKVVAERPEIVLCDIGLPGMSGYEVARALRAALDGGVRLVAVSGYAQPEDVKRSEDAGFDAHVAKPPDLARLEALLA